MLRLSPRGPGIQGALATPWAAFEFADPGWVQAVGLVRRPKLVGAGWHVGLFVETSFGSFVHDRTPTNGLRRVSLEAFAAGRRVEMRYATRDRAHIATFLGRLAASWDDPSERHYDVLQRNCEHLASRVLRGGRRSETLLRVVGAVGLIVYGILANRGSTG